MKVYIKRENLLDTSIWLLIGFYTLIAHWIWYGRGIQETIIILLASIAIVIRSKYKLNRNDQILCILGLALIVEVMIVTVAGTNHNYLVPDLKAMLGSAVVFLYLIQFYKYEKGTCKKYIELSRKLLSAYMWINSIIIFLQKHFYYFLMNKSAIKSVGNNMYEDQLTGFLGINGTTRWNIITCTVIILNFVYASKRNNRKLMRNNFLFIAVSLYISMLNSTRAFLIIMPVLVLFYFFFVKRENLKGKFKIILVGMLLSLILLGVYFTSSFVNAYINQLISDKFKIYFSGDISYMIAANDDRVVAVNYAVKYGGFLGRGIGSIPMHYSDSEVKYLGLNSASSYIYMIGVLGYFVYTLFISTISLLENSLKKIKGIFIFTYIIWLVISYFLPIYSSIILLFGMGMIYIGFSMEANANG